MVGAAGKILKIQIVSNRYFRVMISWKEGKNKDKIRHTLGHFKEKNWHKISITN